MCCCNFMFPISEYPVDLPTAETITCSPVHCHLKLFDCRALLRRYPDFPDMRAALAAADWSIGKLGDAESNYQRLNDPRYRDREWLRVNRRWPPKLLGAWEAFLDIKKVDVS